MFGLAVPPWAYGALALIVALFSFAAYERHQGAGHVMAKVEKAQTKATQAAAQHKAVVVAVQQQVTQKASHDYKQELVALDARYADYRRMHPRASVAYQSEVPNGTGVPGLPYTPSGTDDQTPSGFVPLATAEVIAKEADGANLQLKALQDWVANESQVPQ